MKFVREGCTFSQEKGGLPIYSPRMKATSAEEVEKKGPPKKTRKEEGGGKEGLVSCLKKRKKRTRREEKNQPCMGEIEGEINTTTYEREGEGK